MRIYNGDVYSPEEQQMRSEFHAVRDQFGLIQPGVGRTSGNGLLYSCQYFSILRKTGQAKLPDCTDFGTLITACQVEPGLYRRDPYNSEDYESQDDYIGIACASYLLGANFGKHILAYGESHGWTYNNVLPGVYRRESWLGRYPAFRPTIRFSAGQMPNLWERILLALAIGFAAMARRDDHDSWILTQLILWTVDERCWISRLAGKFWRRRLLKHYPEGISECIGDYFQDHEHPLSKNWPKS